MKRLFILCFNLYINTEFRDENNSSKIFLTGFIYLFLIVISLVGGILYGLLYLNYEKFGIPADQRETVVLSSIFMWFFVVFVMKVFGTNKLDNQVDFSRILFLPLSINQVILVRFLLSSLDRVYLIPFTLLIGFSATLGVLFASISSFIYSIVNIIAIIITLHIFSIITQLLIGYFSHNNKRVIIILIALSIFLIFYTKTINLLFLQGNTNLGIFISWIVYQSINSNFIAPFSLIFINLIICIMGIFIYWFLNFLFYRFSFIIFSVRTNSDEDRSVRKNSNRRRTFLIQNPIINKEIKYILKSSINRTALIITGIFIINYIYLFYANKLNKDDFIQFAFIFSLIDLIFWNSYLNNQWGYDKGGFGVFLYSPIDIKQLLISKNLSFFFVKLIILIPIMFLSLMIFSVEYSVLIFILMLFVNLGSFIISNYTALKCPYPTNLTESVFSKSVKSKLSFVGFIFLILLTILISVHLMIFYFFNISTITYIIYLLLLLLIFSIYIFSLQYTIAFFEREKIKIYRGLFYDFN